MKEKLARIHNQETDDASDESILQQFTLQQRVKRRVNVVKLQLHKLKSKT